eukprot:TRINITY_DN7694_c0_g1_i1.p1 TRINITY_DN7694_c0_g1~~TRINITY_DN7694_c0_g1_i1.p1  ORF type:complete len:658 (+),score=159.87 TRINITY_DN7694_c0_g1_i1:49-2022(+)
MKEIRHPNIITPASPSFNLRRNTESTYNLTHTQPLTTHSSPSLSTTSLLSHPLPSLSLPTKGDIRMICKKASSNLMREIKWLGTPLSSKDITDICSAIMSTTFLCNLTMSSVSISDESIIQIACALEKNSSIRYLDISFNNLSDRSGEALLQTLAKNGSLREIVLFGNNTPTTESKISEILLHRRRLSSDQIQSGEDIEKDAEKDEKDAKTKNTGSKSLRGRFTSILSPLQISAGGSGDPVDELLDLDLAQLTQACVMLAGVSNNVKEHMRELSSTKEDMNKKIYSLKRQVHALQKQKELLEESSAEIEVKQKTLHREVQQLEEKKDRYSKGSDDKPPPSKDVGRKSKRVNGNTRGFVQLDPLDLVVQREIAPPCGSNAAVYACRFDGFDCVMKELRIPDVTDMDAQNFRKEIEIMSKVPKHPNLCRLLFTDSSSKWMRIFMPVYAGNLSNYLKKKREMKTQIPPEKVVEMVNDIAKGLECLHNATIIHRDLKPSNIFIEMHEEEVKQCIIADFGTAKDLNVDTARTCIGTTYTMAPEVIAAKQGVTDPYTLKADIYSFGMTSYELTTLREPFEKDHPFQIAAMIIKGAVPPMPFIFKEDSAYDALTEIYSISTKLKPADRPTAAFIVNLIHEHQTHSLNLQPVPFANMLTTSTSTS